MYRSIRVSGAVPLDHSVGGFLHLDQKKNFDAAIEKYKDNPRLLGEYRKANEEFRSGVGTLTEASFPEYRDGNLAKVVTTDTVEHRCDASTTKLPSTSSTIIRKIIAVEAKQANVRVGT